jgi:hypothetical protein
VSCTFAHDDAAYVLGALSASERAAYQAHLAGCAECTRSVQQLAGLPGLLARVPVDVLESPVAAPLPDRLLRTLVHEVRRTRRRRTWVTVGTAAAAAVVIGGGSLALGGAFDGPPAPTNAAVSKVMTPIGSETMTASLALTPVAWGTRLDLTCTYQQSDGSWDGSGYALVVHTRSGVTEQVATWRGLPGKSMKLTAATASSRDDITSVEIRTLQGAPVLKLLT